MAYRLLLLAAAPFLGLYVLLRILRQRAYLNNLGERFGVLPASFQRTDYGAVWLHAVSVGEVLSLEPLLRELRERLPDAALFVSCGTLGGRAAAERRLSGLVRGVFYAPFDYVFAVRAVLRRLRPALVVVCETEIWPNLWRETRRSGASLAVVNGRISARAAGRYRRIRGLPGPVLRQAGWIGTQSEGDSAVYCELGADPAGVETAGNLKYAFRGTGAVVPEELRVFLEERRAERVVIAASTVAPEFRGDVDEDDAVLAAFADWAAEWPSLLLILAPRKPERFGVVREKLRAAEISHVLRTEIGPGVDFALPGVLLVDTIGELNQLFGSADAVFMGGTLAHRGGHNLLEPASFGKAVVAGPHLENFAEIAKAFEVAEASVTIFSPDGLGPAIARLLRDPAEAKRIGAAALRVAEAHQGVAGAIADKLVALYEDAVPHRIWPGWLRWLVAPLCWLWIWGGAWKRRKLERASVRLGVPVISVGGLAMGGVGKTPCVEWLASWLPGVPAVLTRGYGRASSTKLLIVPAGTSAPLSETGEEAQILIRTGLCHLGIGADRAEAGRRMLNEIAPASFVLDDGFQHARVQRDCDLVLIDSLDPFAGGFVFPMGRLRERISALGRADAFVLTRTRAGRSYAGVCRMLRSVNPTAPIFRARVVADGWEPSEGPSGCVAAFCGLGNPETFRRTLSELGIVPVFFACFPDHHRYSDAEIDSLLARARQAGAQSIVTTEKDYYNLLKLPQGGPTLYWLRVSFKMDEDGAVREWIASKAGVPLPPASV